MCSLRCLPIPVIGIILLISYISYVESVFKTSKDAQDTLKTSTSQVKGFQEKHKISIYYEAICPDSERFMAQLGPVYEDLKDYIQLEFVPFGLSKLLCRNIISGKCEHPVFTCKHGPIGCRANREHDCALQYSESQEKQVKFIMCTMGTSKAPIEKCLKLLNYPVNDVDICLTFDEGTELQLKSYNKTTPLKPQKVPVILIDQEYSKDVQEKAVKDFRIFICNLFSNKYGLFNEKDAPAICRSNDIFPNLVN